MRNTWLVIRREYIERVRSRAFLIFTLLVPALMYAIIVLPSKLMSMKPAGERHVVVVTSDKDFGERVAALVQAGRPQEEKSATKNEDAMVSSYKASVDTDNSDAHLQQLNQLISSDQLDGYLLLPSDVETSRKFAYYTKNASDFIETETMRSAVRNALTRAELSKAGVGEDRVQSIMKSVDVDTLRVDKGKVSKSGGLMAFLFPMVMMMMIYMTVIIYGVSVMRSVIEEKTSRVIEVLLSSVSSKELMIGKIIGVGAVGLTQMLIWALSGAALGTGVIAAARSMMKDVALPIPVVVAFPVFFLLGYLLYSSMYAALGAMVNSDEEAQQMQWPVVMPLVLCAVFASMVIRQPQSPLAFWLSMFPMTAPIIMFVRISVQMPPMWQIATSIGLLVATIYGIMWLSSRIYRVGILMYGKRPTLPEIVKWVKYSG